MTTKKFWIVAQDGEVIDAVDDMDTAIEIIEYHRQDEKLEIYTREEYSNLYGTIFVTNEAMKIVAKFVDEDDAINFIVEYPTEEQLCIYNKEEYDKFAPK